MTRIALLFLLLPLFASAQSRGEALFTITDIEDRWLPTREAADAVGLDLDVAAFATLRSRSPSA